MNKVKILRERSNLTQNELAEKSGVSLRTIQRIEAGSPLKGFSLQAIANALDTAPENLFPKPENKVSTERAKLINLSALAGLIIPFGGIIFPLMLTLKTTDPDNKKIGKDLVSIQIILTAVLSLSLIIIPFVQKYFSMKAPLFICAIVLFLLLKLAVVMMNGISLNKNDTLRIRLKNSFL